MGTALQLIVHKGKITFDSIIVTQHSVTEYNNCDTQNGCDPENIATKDDLEVVKHKPFLLRKKGFNAYLLSAYIFCLRTSKAYRSIAVQTILQYLSDNVRNQTALEIILLRLRPPRKQFLDYKWGEKMTQMVLERQEVEHAMSWLSTLGGAFSALGEQYEHCAKMAGKISVKQFKLAMQLDDPLIVARCKLYAALSLIQQGYLKVPKQMIETIFKFAVEQKDIRLQNMCKGLWAKLKYCYKLRREKKKCTHVFNL